MGFAGWMMVCLGLFGGTSSLAQSASWLPSPRGHALDAGRSLPPERAPELLLVSKESWTLPTEGQEMIRTFVLPVEGLEEMGRIEALQLRVDAGAALAFGELRLDVTDASRERDRAEEGAGFSGRPLYSEVRRPISMIGGWSPARPVEVYPEGIRWPMHPEADVVVTLVLKPDGTEREIQPRVAVWLDGEASGSAPLMLRMANEALGIEADGNDFRAADLFISPTEVTLYGFFPSANRLARSFRLSATAPPGASIGGEKASELFAIEDWVAHRQQVYWLEEPVVLAAGSRLDLEIRYRSSEDGLVTWGPEAGDEAGELLLIVGTDAGGRTVRLVQAIGRHQLHLSLEGAETRSEDSAEGHARLARLYAELGKHETAVSHGRRAVALDETDAEAHAALGAAYLCQDFLFSAQEHLEKAVELDPRDAEAWYNLGNVFYQYKTDDRAKVCFAEALRLSPRNDGAANNLGLLMLAAGDADAAAEGFTRVLERDPFNATATANLGRAFEALDRPDAAVPLYLRAMELEPGMQAVLQPLLQRLAGETSSP